MEYTYDTLSLKQIHECLGKYVKVHLLTGFKTTTTASLEGYLYTIDPITKTLVLLKEKKVTEDSQVPDMEKEGNTREKDQEENGKFINKYQILVIMRSIIQTLCVVNEIKPLSNEKIKPFTSSHIGVRGRPLCINAKNETQNSQNEPPPSMVPNVPIENRYGQPVTAPAPYVPNAVVLNQQTPTLMLHPDKYKTTPVCVTCPTCRNNMTTVITKKFNVCACLLCYCTGIICFVLIQLCDYFHKRTTLHIHPLVQQ